MCYSVLKTVYKNYNEKVIKNLPSPGMSKTRPFSRFVVELLNCEKIYMSI